MGDVGASATVASVVDVRAAEHRIAAAFSQVEEARAAKLPTITLSGGLSHISSDLFVSSTSMATL